MYPVIKCGDVVGNALPKEGVQEIYKKDGMVIWGRGWVVCRRGVQTFCTLSDLKDLKLYWNSKKKPYFPRWSTRLLSISLLFTSFSKILPMTERRLTGQQFIAVDFFHSLNKYRDLR